MSFKDRLESRVPPRFESQYDRLVYLLAQYRTGIYVAVALVVVGYALGYAPTVDIPERLQTALIGVGIGILPAVAVGFAVVDRLVDDPRVEVAHLDLDTPAWKDLHIPRDMWEEKRIIGSAPWEQIEGKDAIISGYDYDEATDTLEVRGVNPEIADPLSITVRNKRLEMTMKDLVDSKRKLNAVEATEGIRKSEMEKQIMQEIMKSFEEQTSISPGTYEDLVDIDIDVDDEILGKEDHTTEDMQDKQTFNDVMEQTQNQQAQTVDD